MKYDVRRMYNWPLTTRIFILFILFLILLYGAYVYDFAGFKYKFASNEHLTSDLKQQFEVIYKQQTALEDEISNFKALSKMLLEWQKKLTPGPNLPELLNEILKIGTTNGLRFNLFTPDVPVKEDTYFKIPIKIQAEGSYTQIANFLSQIANMNRIVAFGDILIAKPQVLNDGKKPNPNVDANTLTLEMIMEVYQLA